MARAIADQGDRLFCVRGRLATGRVGAAAGEQAVLTAAEKLVDEVVAHGSNSCSSSVQLFFSLLYLVGRS